MIRVDSISKSFGTVKAVDNLSFTIKEGEIVGLLGPNGAGKTTTMRMMTGFLSPDRGTISINDIDVVENPIKATSQIGYLPENNPLYKDMLVSELLNYTANLHNLHGSTRTEGINFAVQNTKIEEVFYRPINELSKGYRQRVGMAAALLHRPKILIFDEPTEGYDPNQRAEARSLIKDLGKHHTIIISTHVLAEVEAVASRILIIKDGKLVADGAPSVLTKPVANTIDAVIEGDRVVIAIKSIKGVKKVDQLTKSKTKPELRITIDRNVHVEPEITKLAGKNNWTIWHLSREKQNLESVFAELTK